MQTTLLWCWGSHHLFLRPFTSRSRCPRTEQKMQAVVFGQRTLRFLNQSHIVFLHKVTSSQGRGPYNTKHQVTECLEVCGIQDNASSKSLHPPSWEAHIYTDFSRSLASALYRRYRFRSDCEFGPVLKADLSWWTGLVRLRQSIFCSQLPQWCRVTVWGDNWEPGSSVVNGSTGYQSCYYCFQLQTVLIFAIHYWECVLSACRVLVPQEVWSQLDSCQGHTCNEASNRLQFLGSSASRQTHMDGKSLLLKLPEGTQISSSSMVCIMANLLDHSRLPKSGFQVWS